MDFDQQNIDGVSFDQGIDGVSFDQVEMDTDDKKTHLELAPSTVPSSSSQTPAAPAQYFPTRTAPNIPMPFLQQNGEVFVGIGAQKEAGLVGLGLKKLRSRDKDRLYDAKRYAMDISIKQIMLRQQQVHQQNQQKQQMYAQALSLMARVYVGSISFEIREDMLRKAMEPFGPIKTLNMSWDAGSGHHKGFAFLEYEVPEAATLAQEAMNGLLMGGRNLKVLPTRLFNQNQVGRTPATPQAQPIIDMVMQEAKKYYRVYVASVHPDLSESDVKSVFEAFGEIVSCKLARNPMKGGHRGFGYIEFNNITSMTEAIAGMNMFDLGGQFLRVGRCVTPPEALNYIVPTTPSALPQSAAMALAAATAKVQALEATQQGSKSNGSGAASPSSGVGLARSASPALPKVASPVPSPVIPKQVTEPMAIEASPSAPKLPFKLINATAPPPPPPPPPPQPLPMEVHSPISSQIKIEPEPLIKEEPKPMEIDDYKGDIKPNVAPTILHIPPPGLVQIQVPQPAIVVPRLSTGQTPKEPTPQRTPKKQAKNSKSILDRIKLQPALNPNEVAKFGADEANDESQQAEDEVEGQLAIKAGKNDIQSLALALIDGGSAVDRIKAKVEKEAAFKEAAKKAAKIKRKVKPSKSGKGPKLNTEAALAAAEKAGAMSDVIIDKEVNKEEATLASQEGLEIRGNESRHLLMTKLMRINRSSILLLKNMVAAEEIDDYLEDEIREECSKYGQVEDVLIVNDEGNAVVKIFVRFADSKMVDDAKKVLDGRFFGGRTISASVYDQSLFDHGDYSG